MNRYINLGIATLAVTALGFLHPAHAGENALDPTRADIEQTFGFVPEFLAALPESGAAGLWTMMKGLQMNPDTALDGKTKELIGLAVAAQIPCTYCIHAHIRGAAAYGATPQEIGEAVAVAATIRMGSTFAHGLETDFAQFHADFARILGGE
jgi:AhpD family alkylhydroperoxidase